MKRHKLIVRGGGSVRGAVAACLSALVCTGADARMVLGANVNEHGVALEPELLEQSQTALVRSFFPASPFIKGKRNLENDDDLRTLKRAGASGQKVILCLKWDFERAGWRVPEPDSELEQRCFAWADALIRELDGYLVALETVNEVTVDTLPEDMLPDANGDIPMPRFLNRLVAHLHAKEHKGFYGTPLALFSGGFTRLEQKRMQSNPGVQALLDWIETDARVTGANFHIHMSDFKGFEEYLNYIRTRVVAKPYIVTEFSMVWKYKEHLNKPVSDSPKGSSFLRRYRYPEHLTVREYINAAIGTPVSQQEWNEFLTSQDWYDPGFLHAACKVMEDHGVVIATFAFQQDSSGGRELAPDTTPWIINPIFANRVASGNGSLAPGNIGFFKTYTDWQAGRK